MGAVTERDHTTAADSGAATPATPATPAAAPNVTLVTRTLLLLPALVGLVGIGVTVVAGILGGVTDGPQGWTATAVAALAVTVTVLTGGSYGLYAGLTILAVGGLVADGGPTAAEVTALAILLLLVHEIVRFSLDARSPSRFGPGVVVRYVGRVLAAGVVIALTSAAVHLVIDAIDGADGTARILIPIGLAAAGVPLYIRRGAELLERTDVRRTKTGAAAAGILAVALTVAVVLVAAIGAETQRRIGDTSAADQSTASVTTTTTTTTVPDEPVDTGERTRTLPSWVVVLGVVVLAILIYLILRRDEAIFELEDVDRRVEEGALDLAVGGLGDPEDETVEVDEDALARMLRDLQLDIAAEADPGRAIRFGYATIEQQLADRRLVRAATETEREFLARAIPRLGDAADAMAALTGLFEVARFGHEPVTERMRQDALAAIDALLAEIDHTARNGGAR